MTSRRIRLWTITGAILGASFGVLPVALAELLWKTPSGIIKTTVLFSLWPASVLSGVLIGAITASLTDRLDALEKTFRAPWSAKSIEARNRHEHP